MIEEERVSQARNSRQGEALIGGLKLEIERVGRECGCLRRCADGEIGVLKREVAELKGLLPSPSPLPLQWRLMGLREWDSHLEQSKTS